MGPRPINVLHPRKASQASAAPESSSWQREGVIQCECSGVGSAVDGSTASASALRYDEDDPLHTEVVNLCHRTMGLLRDDIEKLGTLHNRFAIHEQNLVRQVQYLLAGPDTFKVQTAVEEQSRPSAMRKLDSDAGLNSYAPVDKIDTDKYQLQTRFRTDEEDAEEPAVASHGSEVGSKWRELASDGGASKTTIQDSAASSRNRPDVSHVSTHVSHKVSLAGGEYQVNEVWLKSVSIIQRNSGFQHGSRSSLNNEHSSRMRRSVKVAKIDLKQQVAGMLVIHPNGKFHFAWDTLLVLMVLYDVVVIPLRAFELPTSSAFLRVMSVASLVFWTLDMAVSCVTGYRSGGLLIERLSLIALHYMKTWFVFDLVILAEQWVSTVGDFDIAINSDFGIGWIGLVRLLRLAKVYIATARGMEHLNSEFSIVVVDLSKLLLCIVFANHLIACIWYLVGTWNDEWEETWIIKSGIQNRTMGYRYTTSLHWSWTQFTPASMEVVPADTPERIFAVCVLVFAMVSFSSLVSSITNATTRLRHLHKDRLAQYATLRRYLAEHAVTADLVSCIWGHLDRVWNSSQRRCHETDVQILDLLPRSLRTDLQHEVFSPILLPHPFMHHFNVVHYHAMRRVYQMALQEISLSLGQELFNFGEVCSKMYFVVHGEFDYDPQDEHGIPRMASQRGSELRFSDRFIGDIVSSTDWVTEASMWVSRWTHKGKLTAKMQGEIIAIRVNNFQRLVKKDPNIWEASKYAKLYVSLLNSNPQANDLWGEFDILSDLAMNAFTEEDPKQDANEVVHQSSVVSARSGPNYQDGVVNMRRSSLYSSASQFKKLLVFFTSEAQEEGEQVGKASSASDSEAAQRRSSVNTARTSLESAPKSVRTSQDSGTTTVWKSSGSMSSRKSRNSDRGLRSWISWK